MPRRFAITHCRPGSALVLAIPIMFIACAQPPADESRDSAAPGANVQQGPPAPAQDPLVTTDQRTFRARRTGDAIGLDIVATFTNRTGDTVYLHPCGQVQPSFFLEKWVDGAWKPAYSPPCPAILMLDPPRVAPGASRTDTAHVRASTAANSFPRFELDSLAGSYRLVYAQAYGSWRPNEGPGELLPLERRASAPFRIEE